MNAQQNNGWTALICAAWKNHPTIIALLLEHPNIDINIRDQYDAFLRTYGATPLWYAIHYNNTDCADMIRKAGGKV